MRSKATLFACAFWIAAVIAGAGNLAFAQQLRIISNEQNTPAFSGGSVNGGPASGGLADVLNRAGQFERDHRWGDALTVYEDALRHSPGDPTLSPKHELAKIHYDLGRRYSDSSFRRSLTSLKDRDALALYDELLTKIQSHYVAQPNWQELVRRGSASLVVALKEDKFVELNRLADVDKARIEALGDQLKRFNQLRPITNRQQAIEAVSYMTRLAQQQIQLSTTAAVLEYVSGATASLDEYSSYLTSDQLNDVYSQIEGNFVGLGIELKAGDGGLLIVKVITGSPAERGGIRAGDIVTEVDGKSVAKFSTDQAADLLQGPEGSQVEIAVVADGAHRTVRLKREQVDVPSVDDVKIIDREAGVAYLKISCFQKTTSRDLDAALWKLRNDGMQSLVIDVRGNPGGLLTSSVEIADKFIEEGTIVSTRGRSALENYTYTAHKAGTWRMPLVVLIDGDSASASEIFAGAIKDHGRGRVVGETSYGKGSVQGIFPLSLAGSGVRLTTAKFFSPSGRQISHKGVDPDPNFVVHRVAKPLADGTILPFAGEDPVITAAIAATRQPGTTR